MSSRFASSGLFLSRPRPPRQRELDEGMELLGGRYTLRRRLGSGRHATVFAAEDRLRGHEVALKISQGSGVDPKTAQTVLEHELRIYNCIGTHPHVLRVFGLHFDAGTRDGLLLLAMELADGGSLMGWLRQYARDAAYRQSQGKTLFRAMCEGMRSVHHANVRHLDLSPNNFLFCGDTLKVADFGAARHFQSIALHAGREVPPLGCSVCTPPYMAPELLYARDPDEVDHRADIFSVGCIAYQIVHRECRTPFGTSIEEVAQRQSRPLPFLEGVDENLARVIFRCLART